MLGHAEGPGEESDKVGVGFSLDGRCRDAHLEAVPVGACKFVFPGARLDAQVKQQILSFPTTPGLTRSYLKGLPVIACRGGISSIFNRTSPTMTNMGERSRPDMGGIMRRAGASNGFVRLYRIFAAG